MTHRCIKPACDKLGCVGCNCAVPEAVYEAIRAACRAEALEEAAKACDAKADASWAWWESRADPADQGAGHAAEELAAAIREMK